MRYFFSFVVFLFGLTAINTFGQALPDSAFVRKAEQAARKIYSTAIGGDAHLYNGVEYKYPENDLDIGHPYFLSDVLEEGSITYNGQEYLSVEMLYNLVLGVIVIEHAYSHTKIALITEKIESFMFQGHRFVKMIDGPAQTGFYDVLYNGNVKLFALRSKGAYADVKENKPIKMFVVEDQFFIYKDGKYSSVKNKSSVLDVLSEKKTEIKKHLAKNKIRFRKNHEQALIESVRFYDDNQKQP